MYILPIGVEQSGVTLKTNICYKGLTRSKGSNDMKNCLACSICRKGSSRCAVINFGSTRSVCRREYIEETSQLLTLAVRNIWELWKCGRGDSVIWRPSCFKYRVDVLEITTNSKGSGFSNCEYELLTLLTMSIKQ